VNVANALLGTAKPQDQEPKTKAISEAKADDQKAGWTDPIGSDIEIASMSGGETEESSFAGRRQSYASVPNAGRMMAESASDSEAILGAEGTGGPNAELQPLDRSSQSHSFAVQAVDEPEAAGSGLGREMANPTPEPRDRAKLPVPGDESQSAIEQVESKASDEAESLADNELALRLREA